MSRKMELALDEAWERLRRDVLVAKAELAVVRTAIAQAISSRTSTAGGVYLVPETLLADMEKAATAARERA